MVVVNRNLPNISSGGKTLVLNSKPKIGGSITFEKPKLNDVTYNAVKPLNGVVGIGKSAEPYKPAVTPPPVVTKATSGTGFSNIKDISFNHMKSAKKKIKNIKVSL